MVHHKCVLLVGSGVSILLNLDHFHDLLRCVLNDTFDVLSRLCATKAQKLYCLW